MFMNRLRINKLWYSYTIEYSKAVKMNELLIHATCMNLKNFMLSERNQAHNTKKPTVEFHLFKVQEQANLTYRDSS